MRIEEYACPQENVLIDTHDGYASSGRKKTKKQKLRNLLIYYYLAGADFCCKVIPPPWLIANRHPIHLWSRSQSIIPSMCLQPGCIGPKVPEIFSEII